MIGKNRKVAASGTRELVSFFLKYLTLFNYSYKLNSHSLPTRKTTSSDACWRIRTWTLQFLLSLWKHFPKTRHMTFSLIPDTHTHTSAVPYVHQASLETWKTLVLVVSQMRPVAVFSLYFYQMPFPFTLQQTLPQLACPFLYYHSSVTPSQFPQALCPVLPTLQSSTIISNQNY